MALLCASYASLSFPIENMSNVNPPLMKLKKRKKNMDKYITFMTLQQHFSKLHTMNNINVVLEQRFVRISTFEFHH